MNHDYDVAVVGYGPSGLVLASALGRAGHSVVVFQRWPALCGLPRLTHIDGETDRIVQAVGDLDHALWDALPLSAYRYLNARPWSQSRTGQWSHAGEERVVTAKYLVGANGEVFTLARAGAPDEGNGGCARTGRCAASAALRGRGLFGAGRVDCARRLCPAGPDRDLAALLARPAVLPGSGVTIPVTASVGAAWAGRGLSAGLAAADAAMYRAKHTGGGYRIAIPADPVPAPRARTRHHGPQSFAVA